MDNGKLNNDELEEEKSEKYLWLAALIIGVLLIFMLLAIAGIAIWKHFKKDNTANQNWAGPSPLADGNNLEDTNMNECILSRQRSLSYISTAPIIPNELQAPQKDHVPENTSQGHSEEASTQEDNNNTSMPTLQYISSETTSFSSNASEGQPSKHNLQGYSLSDESSLPLPPDDFLQFPKPPQIDEIPVIGEERNLQPLPLCSTDVPQSDKHHNQNALDPENTIQITGFSTCDIDDQFLPPPPPDL
ncbi:protein EVI2B [Mantella aurantiaca]